MRAAEGQSDAGQESIGDVRLLREHDPLPRLRRGTEPFQFHHLLGRQSCCVEDRATPSAVQNMRRYRRDRRPRTANSQGPGISRVVNHRLRFRRSVKGRVAKLARFSNSAKMPRGAKPGERRGGRAKGVPNKKTVERQIIKAVEAGAPNAPAGIAKHVLEEFMMIFRGMAANVQQRIIVDPSKIPEDKRAEYLREYRANVDEFERWAKLAVHTAHWVAPYQSPTFKAIIMDGGPPVLDMVEVIELSIFDDHNKLISHQPADKSRIKKAAAMADEDGDDD